jgi:hypothetical protein
MITAVEKHKVRAGDTVLIRCKVVPTTQGSTREMYPGVSITPGDSPIPVGMLDVVSVEHAFCIGDRVQFDEGQSTHNGEIIGLSSDQPQQAWIKTYPKGNFVTRGIKSLKRI